MVMEERAVSSGRAGERQEPRREQPTSTKCEARGTRCSYCHFVNRTSYLVNLHDFSTTKRFIMAFPERRLRGDRLRRNPQGVFMPRIAKKAISNVASIESGSKTRPEAEKISASASQSAATLEERI